MMIDFPSQDQVPQLLQLWKQAFGDYGGFWEMFLDTGFHLQRCRCITEDTQVTAALCWFDCSFDGQKLAYVYAVVTHPEHRNKGLCRKLLDDTHSHLAHMGYAAVLLVPAQPALRSMYAKLGYRNCTAVQEFSCTAAEPAVPLRAIGPSEYAALRRSLLPPGGVLQEAENLTFLAAQAQFFAGENCLLAAYLEEDTLHCMELLGSRDAAAGIVSALDCKKGHFRCPGDEKPFAMVYPLSENAKIPHYFGFAFD